MTHEFIVWIYLDCVSHIPMCPMFSPQTFLTPPRSCSPVRWHGQRAHWPGNPRRVTEDRSSLATLWNASPRPPHAGCVSTRALCVTWCTLWQTSQKATNTSSGSLLRTLLEWASRPSQLAPSRLLILTVSHLFVSFWPLLLLLMLWSLRVRDRERENPEHSIKFWIVYNITQQCFINP